MPHIHEKIDFTVEVFIVHRERVLLRKHDKYKIWLSVGGHIELDEDPMQTAIREVFEEVGLRVTLLGDIPQTKPHDTDHDRELLAPRYLNRHRVSETHEHVTFIYFATSDTDQTTEQVTDERSEEMHWFSDEELDRPEYGIRDNIRFYAHQALQATQESC